ncbi:MAG: hypothetical protein KBA72_12140 [Thermoanaerobaculia bacterium]|nr:hypothetical protein [Thermoanaerobaculia bacterium]
MSDRSQNRRWLAPLGGLALVASLSSPASAGLVFTQQIRGDGDAAKYQSMTMRTSIDTGGAKMEILSSGNPMMEEGNYILIQPDADAMLLVNPEEKSYASLDLGQLLGAVGQMMGGQESQAPAKKYPDPVVEKLLEEDGGTMLGRPTRHFRWRTQYTMGMNLPMGMSMEVATDQTEDVWVADIAIDPKILRSFEKMGAGAALPENFQKIVEAAKKTQTGFPLKRILVSKTKSTSTGTGMMARMMAKSAAKQEAEGPQTTTFEVTELSEQKVPASVFAIPPGYTETELMAPGMQMPNMNPEN